MTSGRRQGASGRLQILVIGLLFGLPIVAATWLYYNESARPAGRSNHGAILQPIVNLQEALPESPAVQLAQDQWSLLYANDGECEAECRDALYRQRHLRLMLGNDMRRLARLFLRGQLPPDRVFLEEHHPGLRVIEDRHLGELLAARRPPQLPPGGLYLIDPLGNLVMYFSPDLEPADVVEDIEHLLELSRIG